MHFSYIDMLIVHKRTLEKEMKRINIGKNINSLLFVCQMQYSLWISTAANCECIGP
jgi:hypothetical protein